MPLPMVHLAIAVQAHALAEHPLMPEFLLGCLAPDAIHMRANTNREDKNRVHLHISEASEPEVLECIRLLMTQRHSATNVFVDGYIAHLLVDRWWVHTVVRPFAAQFPPDMSTTERRTLYYQETDQVDFNLYNRVPWRQWVWDLLARASAPEFPPYLTADEVNRWRQRTLDWFENLMQEPGIVSKTITDQVVEDFINTSAQRLQPFLFAR